MTKFALLFVALFIAVTMGSCDNDGQNETTEYDIHALIESFSVSGDYSFCGAKFSHIG